MRIDEDLVRRLIGAQRPEWADLKIEAVLPGGWDNRTFRLGDRMAVRLPSAAEYAAQVEREQRWLPYLAPHLPVPIPMPLAVGKPSSDYPWQWSVLSWLEGQPADVHRLEDAQAFGAELAEFLIALQRVDPTGGPAPGRENFFRGGSLATYDAEVRHALDVLGNAVGASLYAAWNEGLTARPLGPSVWAHGDLSPGNLLVNNGRLSAVIDFGQCCVGDPACDLAIAWTFLDPPARAVFRKKLCPDAGTWARGRAWAVWKALVVAAGLADTNAGERARATVTLRNVVDDRDAR